MSPAAEVMREQAQTAEPCVVTQSERLWFLGTLARMKLDGQHTGGRFALWEGVLPHGAAPPLHSHPQDETFYILEGEVTVWLVEPELAEDQESPAAWVETRGQRCGPGAAAFAPGGAPHTFRVESDTARMLFLSTPAGIEEYVRALGESAQWPWLQPPAEGPRVPAERIAAVESELGVVRYGPPPPPAAALR
jgi:quercetin dioxygenase-like cupin family protein